ncbi:MAG TPA: family 10 glycosylhydrolase, partial [Verrucomicrobiota bacterium]|nr:family 10 glycosylhydrolase [Verrucomicrobiota bacterium]
MKKTNKSSDTSFKMSRLQNIALLVFIIFFFIFEFSSIAAYVPSTKVSPPQPQREFRGVWIATVGNIDWPSKPGLPVEQQKSELINILNKAIDLKLNVVIFQVRTSCDAFYNSNIEPWSEFLTGQMGQAPKPFYDPLAFAVEEAHKRGLELHAWFNPFRARYSSVKSQLSSNHISKTKPGIVRQYGKQLWLDPGMTSAQDYVRSVILDVVRRYDIDGVHIDDYFYPYVEKDSSGQDIPFPDNETYNLYKSKGGKLSKGDWRRENINNFIKTINQSIHKEKNWVKFGISPFGIWRPDASLSIRGMDAYEQIFADSKKWINNGWCDYFAPQLYWKIDAQGQSFPVLLKW